MRLGRSSQLAAVVLLAALPFAVAGCAGAGDAAGSAAAAVHDGPVVLLTLGALRADAVGPRATPHLAALAAEADWAGRAVAPADWGRPVLASLATGLHPWLHQLHLPGEAPAGSAWSRDFPALAEAVGERGYQMSTYASGPFLRGTPLSPRALGRARPLRRGAFAEGHLESLGASDRDRQLVWVQMEEPALPYERRAHLRDHLPDLADAYLDSLPRRLEAADVERWSDPAVPMTAPRRDLLAALYRFEVAEADRRLGRYLAALRASPAWDDTLLVVTALHGAPLGSGPGAGDEDLHRGLSRGMLEVPLVVKLPRSLRGVDVATPRDRPVPLTAVWSTLVAAVGGAVPPAVPPGLVAGTPAATLSEHHLGNGVNQVSLVEQDAEGTTWQLVRESRFAPAEPEFAVARLAAYRPDGAAAFAARTGEEPAALFTRLRDVYEATPPLSGDPRLAEVERHPPLAFPYLTLLRWRDDGGSEVVDDPARAAAMARRLERRWLAFQSCERTPAAEAAHRLGLRTGRLAGGLPQLSRAPAAAPAGSSSPAPEAPPEAAGAADILPAPPTPGGVPGP